MCQCRGERQVTYTALGRRLASLAPSRGVVRVGDQTAGHSNEEGEKSDTAQRGPDEVVDDSGGDPLPDGRHQCLHGRHELPALLL